MPTTQSCRCWRQGWVAPEPHGSGPMSEITGRLPEGSPAVLYRYSPDRKSEHPRAHLRDSRGILQADGYAGYAGLYGNRVVEGACMAHARRKFFDVHEATKSPLACEALDRIAALYRIEAQILGRPPDQRLRIRTENTAPSMLELKSWPETTRSRISG